METSMLSQDMFYQKEKRYARNRLIILSGITFLSFGISSEIIPQILLVRLVLGVLAFISTLHYSFILSKPEMFIPYRKNILIFLDLLTLTLLIYVFERYGLLLFPFYILIVMQSAWCFGRGTVFVSILSAVVSWAFLSLYSPYWQIHYDDIMIYAATTLLVMFLFWKALPEEEEKRDEYQEILDTEKKHDDDNHYMLNDIADKIMYKELVEKKLKEKESFALLFINLHSDDAQSDAVKQDLLQEVANRLRSNMDQDDFLAQLGEDKFVIITMRQRVFIRKFLKKIEENVIGHHHVRGSNIRIEISIGISLYPEDGQTEMIISKSGNKAMRAARENSNSHHMFYASIKS